MPITQMSERCRFLVSNLDLPNASGVPEARWEPFQIAQLNDNTRFRILNKGRQIAFSWTSSAEAVANAILYGQDTAIVSINLDESAEKIRYAIAIYENLRVAKLPKISRQSQLRLEFDNGARIQSLPSRPPRGRSRTHLVFDEFAHVLNDKAIYQAGLPILSKGNTRLRIGSSPFAAQGTFWEIYSESIREYPGYNRARAPWWFNHAFCTNPRAATKMALEIEPHEQEDLVQMYGRQTIHEIYLNSLLEDFLQEYCCEFLDEQLSWIPWEEIRSCQEVDHLWINASATKNKQDKVRQGILDLAEKVGQGKIEDYLVVGVDIGRTNNRTEIIILGRSRNRSGEVRYALRARYSLDSLEFDDQFDLITDLISSLPIKRCHIDRNGIGRNLAENLNKKFPKLAFGMEFTNKRKVRWATDAKMMFQKEWIKIPVDRDIAYQIHSIRRIISGNNMKFDVAATEKHHADIFWALALAISAMYRITGRQVPPPITQHQVAYAI